jgi:hypothetical protein
LRINKKALTASIISVALLLILAITATSVGAQTGSTINIEILESVGGTTNPAPGAYQYAEGTVYTISAIPDEGWIFDHWVLTGDIPGGRQSIEVLDNPVSGDCGYGYSYQYQAVFAPTSALSSAPLAIAVEYVAIIVVVACAVAAIGAYSIGKRKAK